ncbi:hypothetical protein L3V86_00340 [Thiotrichales bacterium 19S11-10]|nr:hypothetical protein [Thiotrichales bacterium 19S11-10]
MLECFLFRFFFQLVLKYSRDKELAKRLVDVLERHPELRHYFDKKDFKKAFVQLLISLDLDSKKTAKATLKKLDSLTGANIMTLREQWENEAIKEGMKKGMEKGLEQRAIEIARSMLADNMSIPTIGKYTGLEKSTILALKKDIDNK